MTLILGTSYSSITFHRRPNGLQEELSQPVVVLLNEDAATMALASQAGFRCFSSGESFRNYVSIEVLAGAPHG